MQNYTLKLVSLLFKSEKGFTPLISLNNGGLWVDTTAWDGLLVALRNPVEDLVFSFRVVLLTSILSLLGQKLFYYRTKGKKMT